LLYYFFVRVLKDALVMYHCARENSATLVL
jgi:hypothetical protein